MANRTNLTDTVVTARKFVPIGKDAATLKNRIKSISASVSSYNSMVSFDIFKGMAEDEVITPQEKRILASEWEQIQSGFAQISLSAQELELDDTELFSTLESAYANLRSEVEAVLYDMNTSSIVSYRFTVAFDSYASAANSFNSFLIAEREGIQEAYSKTRLEVVAAPSEISPEDDVTLSARIIIDNVDMSSVIEERTGADEDGLYPSLYKWHFSGTKDDEYFNNLALGQREFTVPASDIFHTLNFEVFFESVFDFKAL